MNRTVERIMVLPPSGRIKIIRLSLDYAAIA
jgi:hypothetical protein